MACQLLQWILAGAGPTTLQHGLLGVGCLLAFDIANRWRKRRHPQPAKETLAEEKPATEYRRAA